MADATSMPAGSGTSGWVSAPLPLESLIEQSATIVTGEVTETGSAQSTLLIDAVLKGSAEAGEYLAVDNGSGSGEPTPAVGDAGVWFLGAGSPPVLLQGGRLAASAREVERVLAGLPRVDGPPSGQQLQELAERADAVVWVTLTSDDGVTATATNERTLKGEAPATFTVRVGDQPTQPGGPWQFPAGGQRASAVLFLAEVEGQWVAINPTDPTLYRVGVVSATLN